MRAPALLLVLVPLAVSPLHPQSTEPLRLIHEELGPGIHLFRAPDALDRWTATNVVAIINDRDVTVFDSFTRAGTARMAIVEIRKLTDKPVRTLINSHWHQDHWSGNNEFQKAWPEVQIVATTGTRDYMKRMPSPFFAEGLVRSVTRMQATLDSAVRTGRQADGTPLTADLRRTRQLDIDSTAAFEREVRALPRVLPTMAYTDSLVLWSGGREFRLLSVTGDATASTALYLPAEKLLVTGDALVAQEDGQGPPPWTTNSFAITPWLESLRRLEALDVSTIVPGQGKAFKSKEYLRLTIEVYAAVIDQVHAALERGVVGQDAVVAAVNVDELGRRYRPNQELHANFKPWVGALARKVYQESLDGIAR
jgi:glyoxylase-like metal-dependent hydrolase (beta-lactamase superfamily II)